jgi:hypothetical protein
MSNRWTGERCETRALLFAGSVFFWRWRLGGADEWLHPIPNPEIR